MAKAGEVLMYYVVARSPGGLRYGVKEPAGVYATDRPEGATGFQVRSEAQELAEELTDLHDKIGLRFEVKEEIKCWKYTVGARIVSTN